MKALKNIIKRAICKVVVLCTICTACSCGTQNGNRNKNYEDKENCLGITTASDGTLLIEGSRLQAFGVNIYDVFINKRLEDPDYDCEAPFKALHEAGIPVARVSVGPYHVAHLAKYYYEPDEYFEALDAVIAAAEKWKIGIVASISWNSWVIPEFVNEHLSKMGDAESETVAFAKKYYADVVTRYKDSPAIWMWEMGNEYNLNADLGYVAGGLEYLPGQLTFMNEPRTWEDYYTSYDIQNYYRAVAETIREIDPDRLITGGDSELSERPASLRKEARWGADTVEDLTETTLLYAPSPMEAVSSHMYQGALTSESDMRNFDKVLSDALSACKSAKKGYYIGEYGPGMCWNNKTATEELYEKCVDAIHEACLKNNVQLALAWNCTTDYDGTEKSLGSDFAVYWFGEIKRINKELADDGKQDNIKKYWENAKKTLDYDEIGGKCSNYMMCLGNPGMALKIKEDGSGFVYWTGSDYDTNAEILLSDDTLADGSVGKVFTMKCKDDQGKTLLKYSDIRGLKNDGSYILSFWLKTEDVQGAGLTVKMGSPLFFSEENIKCSESGTWQYFEFETGAPEKNKDTYSLSFYFQNQQGSVSFYGIEIRDK